MSKALTTIAGKLEKKFDCTYHIQLGELIVVTSPDNILKVLNYLRDETSMQFRQLCDVCGVDYPQRPKRFEVVYNLLSIKHNLRIRIKVPISESEEIPSCVDLFAGANWWEREAWDMYGIVFAGHKDLRRLLSDYNFDGHPLRKDFPLSGHVELRYDEKRKDIVSERVNLQQAYREFDFLSPWEGQLPGDEKAVEKEVKEAKIGGFLSYLALNYTRICKKLSTGYISELFFFAKKIWL